MFTGHWMDPQGRPSESHRTDSPPNPQRSHEATNGAMSPRTRAYKSNPDMVGFHICWLNKHRNSVQGEWGPPDW